MLTRLPETLERFRSDHPEVDLELSVELSGTLHERLAAGKLDLVLAKRRPEDPHGELVWHDRMVWIGAERLRLAPDRPLPLIVYPPPGISRALALEALEREGRAWRVACTSGSLNGLIAAARTGLGVMAHSQGLVPPGLSPVPEHAGLPELGEVDFVLVHGRHLGPAAEAVRALAAAVLAGGDRLHRGRPGAAGPRAGVGPGTPRPVGCDAGVTRRRWSRCRRPPSPHPAEAWPGGPGRAGRAPAGRRGSGT